MMCEAVGDTALEVCFGGGGGWDGGGGGNWDGGDCCTLERGGEGEASGAGRGVGGGGGMCGGDSECGRGGGVFPLSISPAWLTSACLAAPDRLSKSLSCAARSFACLCSSFADSGSFVA